ncbi:hypothetical protein B9Z55_003157 [Caenorhabditis nigoni]|uniref:DUF7154 domain-containing protein n=1 Tax=Caenorhabditis nigoni TaxID=1611254 RepID=A0A2G5VNQ9_9PELO|nr:hypothetical protein B9Z55_003157 [Caenorhabditis nigoni]
MSNPRRFPDEPPSYISDEKPGVVNKQNVSEVVGYEIDINDLFNSSPKTEDLLYSRISKFSKTKMQDVVGYEININDLFNLPPKTEDVHYNNTNIEYDYPSTEGNDQEDEGIYDYIDEFSKPTVFLEKYCCKILAVFILASLVAVYIIVFLVVPATVHHTDIPRCAQSPLTSPAYLLAYSNDLDKNIVSQTADKFFGLLDKTSSSYATVRFDTQPMDLVNFAKNTSSALSTVQSRLPDPALGFKYSQNGSDIISAIERYYTEAEQNNFSTCGAIIMILLKRLPIKTDISDVVAKIRANSGMVIVLTSTSPSGDDQPKIVYRIASKTNGMGIFVDDETFPLQVIRAPIYGVRPIYCANVQVSELNTYYLPSFTGPKNAPVMNRVSFTTQDHAPIDSFQSLDLKFLADTNLTFSVNAAEVRNAGSTGFSTTLFSVPGVEYRIELDCDYNNTAVEELQIRVHGSE